MAGRGVRVARTAVVAAARGVPPAPSPRLPAAAMAALSSPRGSGGGGSAPSPPEVVLLGHPALRRVARAIPACAFVEDEDSDQQESAAKELAALSASLRRALLARGGGAVGVAAPQLGINRRAVAVQLPREAAAAAQCAALAPRVLVNPRLRVKVVASAAAGETAWVALPPPPVLPPAEALLALPWYADADAPVWLRREGFAQGEGRVSTFLDADAGEEGRGGGGDEGEGVSVQTFVAERAAAVLGQRPEAERWVAVDEQCLSIPGLIGRVPRYGDVQCDFVTPGGRRKRLHAGGYLAIVLQHEVDHLDGVLFTDRTIPHTLAFEREHTEYLASEDPEDYIPSNTYWELEDLD